MYKYSFKNRTKYFLLVHLCSYRHPLIAVLEQKVNDKILEFSFSVGLIIQ